MAMTKTKQAVGAGALVLLGAGAGGAAMVASSASAETSSEDSGRTHGHGPRGEGRCEETPLNGAKLTKVTDAVEAEYPGATIERAETDSEGSYEAHLTTADGERLRVLLDEDFAITGTETGAGPGRHGHGPRGEGRSEETPLSGAKLTKVTDAVEAEYPGATIERAETDSEGTYEAHLTTADGQRLRVLLDEDFAITGTETGRGGGHHHGPDATEPDAGA